MVVRTVLSDVVPWSALKVREIGTTNWSWGRGVRCGVVAGWGIHIDGILSSSCCIGCYSHYLHIWDDGSNQPGSLSIETSGILEDESFLKDSLSGLTETAWVGGSGNLWWRELSGDWLIWWGKRWNPPRQPWLVGSLDLWWWRRCPSYPRVVVGLEWQEMEQRTIVVGWGWQYCWSRGSNQPQTSLEGGKWGLERLPSWASHWQCRQILPCGGGLGYWHMLQWWQSAWPLCRWREHQQGKDGCGWDK